MPYGMPSLIQLFPKVMEIFINHYSASTAICKFELAVAKKKQVRYNVFNYECPDVKLPHTLE
jgi:hypothetical protein